jgi:hypothetical protein
MDNASDWNPSVHEAVEPIHGDPATRSLPILRLIGRLLFSCQMGSSQRDRLPEPQQTLSSNQDSARVARAEQIS